MSAAPTIFNIKKKNLTKYDTSIYLCPRARLNQVVIVRKCSCVLVQCSLCSPFNRISQHDDKFGIWLEGMDKILD